MIRNTETAEHRTERLTQIALDCRPGHYASLLALDEAESSIVLAARGEMAQLMLKLAIMGACRQ